jgi:pimeloyl-ACP methyl ester carboxylesterase
VNDTGAPDAGKFDYTLDNLATYVEELLFGVLGLNKFSIYVQDYGAPVGYRIASKNPDAIEGIVVQNGNAYAEGIGAAFDAMKPFWVNRNAETEKPVRRELGSGDRGWRCRCRIGVRCRRGSHLLRREGRFCPQYSPRGLRQDQASQDDEMSLCESA